MHSDEQLIDLLKAGDNQALEETIDRYSNYVAAIVWQVGAQALSVADKEEVMADVFIALWKNAHRLQNAVSLKPYLAAIARNKTRDRLRSLGQTTAPLEDDVLILSDSQRALEKAWQSEYLRLALAEMSREDRTIFYFHYYLMEKVTDIAAMLDMKPSTVKSRLFRGRQQLRQILEERGFSCATENFRYDE